MKSLMDLLDFIRHISKELNGKIPFDDKGWPVFSTSSFLASWPQLTIPFDYRNSIHICDKNQILLNFFSGDARIYPRFQKLEKEIDIYREYLGVVFPDITVTSDMDIDFQKTIILANHLFAAYLAVNGVKIVCNTRTGGLPPSYCFDNIPRGVMCASGFLGCQNAQRFHDAALYMDKILTVLPGKLLIYGKRDLFVDMQLDRLGINYRYFMDFHRICRKKTV